MVRLSNQKLLFGAFTKGIYTVQAAQNTLLSPVNTVTVYELEPKDMPIISLMEYLNHPKRLWRYEPDSEEAKGNLRMLKRVLEESRHTFEQQVNHALSTSAKLYLAVADKQPCGILLGNFPKLKYGNGQDEISHSLRAKPGESEVDWIMTWPLSTGKRLKGVGQILLSQFLDFCVHSGKFQSVYARSDNTPVASGFWRHMGFLQTGPADTDEHADQPRYISFLNHPGKTRFYAGKTIPMAISLETMNSIISDTHRKYPFQQGDNCSREPKDILSFPQSRIAFGFSWVFRKLNGLVDVIVHTKKWKVN